MVSYLVLLLVQFYLFLYKAVLYYLDLSILSFDGSLVDVNNFNNLLAEDILVHMLGLTKEALKCGQLLETLLGVVVRTLHLVLKIEQVLVLIDKLLPHFFVMVGCVDAQQSQVHFIPALEFLLLLQV